MSVTIINLVFFVIFFSRLLMLTLKVSSSLSHNTSLAFLYETTFAVDIYVRLGTITSSFCFMFNAVRIESSAEVPLFIATAFLTFKKDFTLFSKR